MDDRPINKVKKSRNWWKWSTILLALLLLAGVGAYFLKYLRIPLIDKYSGDGSTRVCGEQLVSRYNDAFLYIDRGGDKGVSTDKAGLEKIASEIKSLGGSENDPTCQSMIFWIATASEKNYDEAKAAYEKLNTMQKTGRYADSNLRTTIPFFSYSSQLEAISGKEQEVLIDNAGQ